ncbi:hypothetical protein PanWU01x14_157520 [Parasponia andersonii]|uniref:Retroviral polymerase SH3-like domain-containing protein n=1 Tax=Parasponia andersonii TaxID=3476 RepID=A0A2P5CFB1_PARAD|nr:hypothetical protein PanWU01x14_157520 [Parasponia andersonii]
MPSRVLKFKIPCQALLLCYPNTRIINTLSPKIFGYTMFVHDHSQHWSKLDIKAIKCIFFGCSPSQKGYKYYSNITRKFYTIIDITFFETESYFPKINIQGEKPEVQECKFWQEPEISILQPSKVNIILNEYNLPIIPESNEPDTIESTLKTSSFGQHHT